MKNKIIKFIIIISITSFFVCFIFGCSGNSNGSSPPNMSNVWTKKPFKFKCEQPVYGWDYDSTSPESYLSVAKDSLAYLNVTWQMISNQDSISKMFVTSADSTVFILDSGRVSLMANVACSTNVRGKSLLGQGKLFVCGFNSNSLKDTLDTLGWSNIISYNWKNIGTVYYYPIQNSIFDPLPSQMQTGIAIKSKFDLIAKQAVERDSDVVQSNSVVNWDINSNGKFDLYNGSANNPEIDTIKSQIITRPNSISIFHIAGLIRDNWRITNNLIGSHDTTIPPHDSIIPDHYESHWTVFRPAYYDTTYSYDTLGNVIRTSHYHPDSAGYVSVLVPPDTISVPTTVITLPGSSVLQLESLEFIDTGLYHIGLDGSNSFETVHITSTNVCIGGNCVKLHEGVSNYYSAGTATLSIDGRTNAFHYNDSLITANYILLSDNSSDILTTIVHEILHTSLAGGLSDLEGLPDNIMYFSTNTGKHLLQYRPLKHKYDSGTDRQWNLIHGLH